MASNKANNSWPTDLNLSQILLPPSAFCLANSHEPWYISYERESQGYRRERDTQRQSHREREKHLIRSHCSCTTVHQDKKYHNSIAALHPSVRHDISVILRCPIPPQRFIISHCESTRSSHAAREGELAAESRYTEPPQYCCS